MANPLTANQEYLERRALSQTVILICECGDVQWKDKPSQEKP